MNDPHAGQSAKDTWDQGAAYEQYMGRWSRSVAREFLAWITVAPGSRWLDVGCGTGELSRAILERVHPRSVTAADLSPAFAAFANGRSQDARLRFVVASAQQLPVQNQCMDAVVSGLALNFFPDPLAAVREMVRVVRPGGLIAAYAWDYAGQMQMLRLFWDAVVALHPDAASQDEGLRFPVCHPGVLEAIFQSAGLTATEFRSLEVPTRFRNFEDYWLPFLSGQGPAPGFVRSLSEESRNRLRDALHSRLPEAPDGSIPLIARAWAVRGWKNGPPTA